MNSLRTSLQPGQELGIAVLGGEEVEKLLLPTRS